MFVYPLKIGVIDEPVASIPILAEKPVIPHFWQFLSLITSLFQV